MLLFMRGRPRAYKTTALVTSLLTLGVAIYLFTQFHAGTAGYQFQEDYSWISSLGIRYHLGVDGISLLLVLLTTVLSVVAILGSWNSIKDRGLAFFISLLVLETGMLGVFVSMDLFLFYMFWEIQLIPMYFIIGIWGGARRVYAAIKFFLFTFVGSVLMLVAILAVVWTYGTRPGLSPTFDILDAAAGRLQRLAGHLGRSSPSSSRSPSRCPCSRCTPGSPTPTPRRPPPARSSWPACS